MTPHTGTAERGGDLFLRARAGDRDAENALFERLDARIRALAKRRVWDEQAAEDIAQETLATAFEKFREAEMPRGLLPWVFTILHNKVGNYLKRRRVEAARTPRGAPELHWETAGVSTESEIAVIEFTATLERALRRVSAECRTVFRFLLAGRERSDIRKAFGNEPLGTIDSRISRCREKLLRHLEEMGRETSR
jgi:RNA polymerase sigma factor (sigma-70 family)